MFTAPSAPHDVTAPRAEKPSAPRCEACGASIVRATTGRPRTTCSERCRRAADFHRRKLRRRREWLDAWRAVAALPNRGGYTRDRVRLEIRALVAELVALTAASTSHHQSATPDSYR